MYIFGADFRFGESEKNLLIFIFQISQLLRKRICISPRTTSVEITNQDFNFK